MKIRKFEKSNNQPEKNQIRYRACDVEVFKVKDGELGLIWVILNEDGTVNNYWLKYAQGLYGIRDEFVDVLPEDVELVD